MGRRLRTRLDFIHPDTAEKIIKKQKQRSATLKKKLRRFQVGDKVYVKDFAGQKVWIPGTIVDIKGPLSYKINAGSGQVCRQHVNQVQSWHDDLLNFVMHSTAEEEWIDDGLSMTITSATTLTVRDSTTSSALPSVRRSNREH